jgi:hypothetical protein
MGTSYHTKTRTNIENFCIPAAAGDDHEVTITLSSYSAPDVEDADADSVSLRIKVDQREVLLESDSLSHLLHPLIEALRLLLAAQTVNEDELDDMWTAAAR